jgi:hypothetical protein
MKLPNADNAVVSQKKVLQYLLSERHARGRHKAAFFGGLGFVRHKWQVLAAALKNQAELYEVSELVESEFGTRYVIDGAIEGPNRIRTNVRTVWLVENGENTPRLITAYPRRRSTPDDERT